MAFLKPRIAVPVPTSTDFSYNRQCWKQYAEALSQAGAEPLELPLSGDRRSLREVVSGCDGVCLPGSPADVDPARYGMERDGASAPADPAREAVDFFLLDWAAEFAKPVLAICFGLQSLNVWAGGSLVQDLNVLPVNHAAGASVAVAHNVLISADSALVSLLGCEEALYADGFLQLPVNSSHHQAVASPGDGLRIVGRCPDDGVIEALELDPNEANGTQARAFPSWLLGVQWHPERSTAISAGSRSLFRELVQQASRAAQESNVVNS